jgi:hypothetical protein
MKLAFKSLNIIHVDNIPKKPEELTDEEMEEFSRCFSVRDSEDKG